ncbi:MAG: hypothetical protein MUF50_02730 [Planctomycetes bacterium]|jgi:hypothetical protein|nr:hypothetical protein [Planctomycetota bacterium]
MNTIALRRKLLALSLSAIFLLALFVPKGVRAGFGISPPYVNNTELKRGSIYEQQIVIVRDKPDENLQADLNINVPGAEDWISVDKGMNFVLPAGAKQVPITVKVEVPKYADYQEYKGNITINTKSAKIPQGGTVAIALGAQINIDLKVVKEDIIDFAVRNIKILPTEENRALKLLLSVENTGNILAAPSKATLEIYDFNDHYVATLDNANQLHKIQPYKTEDITAEFATNSLQSGSYWINLKVYSGERIIRESRLSLNVLPYGSLPAERTEQTKKSLLLIVFLLAVFSAFAILLKIWRNHFRPKCILGVCKFISHVFKCRHTQKWLEHWHEKNKSTKKTSKVTVKTIRQTATKPKADAKKKKTNK